MSDEDWRVEIDLHEDAHRAGFVERLFDVDHDEEAEPLRDEAEAAFQHRLGVTHDGPVVFIYPHDRTEAERAVAIVHHLLDRHRWTADVKVTRWHPDEELWEDANLPGPATGEERAGEREKLVDRERQETAAAGVYEFEVLATLAHHGQARELEEKLRGEGVTVARRWRYVVAGAADEDAAERLAAQMRSEAPSGSKVAVWTAKNLHDAVLYQSELAAGNPFVIPPRPRG